MHAELAALDGARAGEIRLVRKDFATLGRHPSADIGFDSERDLDVSGRHAALFRQGDAWVLRDLGSTNGTFVNEVRIRNDRVLAPGDVIGLGVKGPRLRFSLASEAPGPGVEAAPDAAPTAPARPRGAAPADRPRRQPATRERVQAGRTARWRRVTTVFAIALLGAAAAVGFAWRRARALERERAALVRQLDSLATRLDATAGGAAALATALQEARDDAARLRRSITEHPPTRGRLAELSRDVSTKRARYLGVARAAELDALVSRARLPAVALVVAELPGGRQVSGTGLTVRARGDTGWILTSRHLVVDSAGGTARRVGAVYHGTAQNFRARVAATADSADLALLVVLVRGGVPEAAAIATGAAVGDPVAVLGYPFGFAFPMAGDWRKVGVSATTFSGTVTGVTTDALEIDGYGATGSSGSPVLDAAGAVVGLVFGGDPRSHGRMLYAVPASAVRAFLAQHGL
jgi:S1-C subfamily serine protease